MSHSLNGMAESAGENSMEDAIPKESLQDSAQPASPRQASASSDPSPSSASSPSEPKHKDSLLHHLKSHALDIARVVFYFFCSLVVLQTFRCATLMAATKENEFLTSYATAAFTALILGKSVFILEKVRITRLLDEKPVLTVVIYKTILFTVFTDLILCLEHLIKHHSFSLFESSGDSLKYTVCFGAHQLALVISYGLFFTARELDVALGRGTIARHFFGERTPAVEKSDGKH